MYYSALRRSLPHALRELEAAERSTLRVGELSSLLLSCEMHSNRFTTEEHGKVVSFANHCRLS